MRFRQSVNLVGIFILPVFLVLFLTDANAKQEEFSLQSPDGRIQILFQEEAGRISYQVAFDGEMLLEQSALGFRFKNAPDLGDNLRVEKVSRREFDETWQPVWGEESSIRNHFREMVLYLKETEEPNRRMQIVFRAYNDGVAFRYLLPRQPALQDVEITSEETRFRFAGNYTAWWIPADWDSYEHLYRQTPLSKVPGANTPITLMTEDSIYLSIHEAALTDYAGMTLKKVAGTTSEFECDLVPWPDGIKVRGTTPLKTPWRTIQIADRPGGLIESHLILNLNEPCALKDVSWIRPMKYVGIWWGMHIGKWTWYAGPKHGATTERTKKYMDFAAEHHIPAVLVEGWNRGWESWLKQGTKFSFTESYPDFDLEEVVRYGREKGVVLIGHHETGGNVPDYERQMEAAMSLYERLGVPAVKTGYAGKILPDGQHHHGQWMVRHYRRVVEAAARHHLMIDAHEQIKPTGIRRTYPNMLTREGVRGMEYNAWSEGNPPEHTTIVPFTRMLAGPLDYTPGIFNILFDPSGKHRVHTTLAHQLALYVVLYSPLQMAADLVENYRNHPAFRFIEAVPVNWDETRVLNGRIGDYVTIVRRQGEHWFLGSVTDENARRLNIPLDFLSPGQTYRANLYIDAPEADWKSNPTAYRISEQTVSATDTLTLQLAPGGGAAVTLRPLTTRKEGE